MAQPVSLNGMIRHTSSTDLTQVREGDDTKWKSGADANWELVSGISKSGRNSTDELTDTQSQDPGPHEYEIDDKVMMDVRNESGRSPQTFYIVRFKPQGGSWLYQLRYADGTPHEGNQWFAESDLEAT